jgi:hypothetical protein
MSEHLKRALNPNNKKSLKFYNRIVAHNWDAYRKFILISDLTREKARMAEIETIAKYRTFEFGLNSTPGGDGYGSGADNPRSQAVNVYNNRTGEITSFLWAGSADEFLGVSRGTVAHIANPNADIAQTKSSKINMYFQVKYVYDKTPFVKNMPTPDEKSSKKRRKRIVIYNLITHVETEYDGTDLAAATLGISNTNIQYVLD